MRGLDYYNKTVFEITAGELGAQNSVCGGGRYDGLAATIGGPDVPSVGFSTGLERLLQTMMKQGAPFPPAPHPTIFLIPLGEKALNHCFNLACQLRHHEISAEIDMSGKKVGQGLQLANQLNAKYCLIIGEEELTHKRGQLKEMATRETIEISLEDLISQIKKLTSEQHV